LTQNREDFYIGNFRIAPSRNLLITPDEQRLAFEPRIMDVLCALAETPRDVVSRDHLINNIWQVQYGGDESLTRAVSLIRKTFKKAGYTKTIIETIPKRGYRLVSDISTFEAWNARQPQSTAPELITKQPPTPTIDRPENGSTARESTAQMQPSQISEQASLTPKPNRNIRLIIPAAIIGVALFAGWFLGRSSMPDTEIAPDPAATTEVKNTAQTPGQADLALMILFTHLDGQMTRADAMRGAKSHLDLAIENNPGEPNTKTAQGWMHLLSQEPQKAMIAFERAIAADPAQANAWLGKAHVSTNEENYELALFCLEEVIALDAFSFRARVKKAEVSLLLEDFKEASEEIDSILAFAPNNVVATKLAENIRLFKIYDRNNDNVLSLGEISADDQTLHQLLDLDNRPGLSVLEFKAKGKRDLALGTEGELPVNFDLTDPAAPVIQSGKVDKTLQTP